MNYFEFYNITPSLHVDEKELKAKYYDKMRALHPDMHVGASEDSIADTLKWSSYNNEAYKVLKDFYTRMKYLLETFSRSEPKKDMPQMFLMEMMDVNEEMMELQFDYDVAKADQIKSNILEREEKMKVELLSKLKGVDYTAGLSEEVSNQIQEFLLKRNYLLRILENLDKFAPQ